MSKFFVVILLLNFHFSLSQSKTESHIFVFRPKTNLGFAGFWSVDLDGQKISVELKNANKVDISVKGSGMVNMILEYHFMGASLYLKSFNLESGRNQNHYIFLDNIDPLEHAKLMEFNLGKRLYEDDKKFKKMFNHNYSVSNNKRSGGTSGTGFLISSVGYIITNHHVIDKSEFIYVKNQDGDSINAKVIAIDSINDLAILKINNSTVKYDTIPYCFVPNYNIETGDEIFVLGYPMQNVLGTEVKLTRGVISSASGYGGDSTTFQFDAAVQPGNSGSPLFNANGKLIGVVNAKVMKADNVSYAIKPDALNNLLKEYGVNYLPCKIYNNDVELKVLTKKISPATYIIYAK